MNLCFDLVGHDDSWLYLILFGIFFLTCLRTKGNIKFVGAMFRDVIGVRERDNMFDVTVRETSFKLLAILLTAASTGVLLFNAIRIFGNSVWSAAYIPGIALDIHGSLVPVLICMALVIAYIAMMWMCYFSVGRVFSDQLHTSMWVRGYTASLALGALLFFPIALVAIAYPQLSLSTSFLALFVLILVKIVFIIKGFRIFFTESSLWVVFLYYLCILEIIPLSITFGLACSLLS